MIAQIASGHVVAATPVKAPIAATTAMQQAPGAASAFGDLVQQIIHASHSSPVASVPAKSIAAAAVPVPAPPAPAPVSTPVPVPVPAPDAEAVPLNTTEETIQPVPTAKVPVPPVPQPEELTLPLLPLSLKATEITLPLPGAPGTVKAQRKAEGTKSATPAAVTAPVPVFNFFFIKPEKAAATASEEPVPAAPAPVSDEAAPTIAPQAALELKIRPQELPAPPPVAQAQPQPPLPIPQPVSVPVVTTAVQPAVVSQTAPALTAPVLTVPHQQPPEAPAPRPHLQQAASASAPEETIADEPKAQPLKSVSIEFTPDGAQDVKLRLSERAGDVHISLHSTDPSLSGRLNDGVKDLVHSLTTAGYDAQAWTPGQGRQNQRQEDEPRRTRRNGSNDPGAESFSGMMLQPVQEIS